MVEIDSSERKKLRMKNYSIGGGPIEAFGQEARMNRF